MEVHHPDVQKLADEAYDFVAGWFKKKSHKWVAVVGDVGCGKTRVTKRLDDWCRGVTYERWLLNGTGSVLPTIELAHSRILSPELTDAKEFDNHCDRLAESSLVFLDDVGTETDQFRSGLPTFRLCEILNLCEDKYLWLTTNVGLRDWADKWGRRVEDRLLSARVVEIKAPSWRSEV